MENNDIKIDNLYGNFKFRVNGILMHDDEILVVKMKDDSFYCLPGGHVKLGEDSKSAVIREIKEEFLKFSLLFRFSALKLLAVHAYCLRNFALINKKSALNLKNSRLWFKSAKPD